MAVNEKKQQPKMKQPKVTKKAGGAKSSSVTEPSEARALTHELGVTPGAVDVTGIVPEDVRVDPDITEGHPGYEESGGSEIHPTR